MVGTGGLEPPTSRLSGVRSNHLSYAPIHSEQGRPGGLLRRTFIIALDDTHVKGDLFPLPGRLLVPEDRTAYGKTFLRSP